MVIVNTGRKSFSLSPGQVWKSREKRGPVRLVRIDSFTRTHVVVKNTGSGRMAKVYLQDFVARFDLEGGA